MNKIIIVSMILILTGFLSFSFVGPDERKMKLGFQTMQSSCITCHSMNGSEDGIAGPNWAEIRKAYIKKGTTRAKFAEDMSKYMTEPSEKTAKMPDAVKRYGMMMTMYLTEDQLDAITEYLYFTELDRPGWYEAQFEKDKQKYTGAPTKNPLEQGLDYALQAKALLGQNLVEALNTRGTAGAVDFCSGRAVELTDSISKAHGVFISRVSDKSRNRNNKAKGEALDYIRSARESIARNEKPKPRILDKGDKWISYYPISTDGMCLQCHGDPQKDINADVMARLRELYPNDLATGYTVNDLRGIWIVEMSK